MFQNIRTCILQKFINSSERHKATVNFQIYCRFKLYVGHLPCVWDFFEEKNCLIRKYVGIIYRYGAYIRVGYDTAPSLSLPPIFFLPYFTNTPGSPLHTELTLPRIFIFITNPLILLSQQISCHLSWIDFENRTNSPKRENIFSHLLYLSSVKANNKTHLLSVMIKEKSKSN